MRAGEDKSGIIPILKDRCHNLIFFIHTKLVRHSFIEGGFERRKK